MAIARLSAADVGAIGSACLESRDELRERFFLSAVRVTVTVTVRVTVTVTVRVRVRDWVRVRVRVQLLPSAKPPSSNATG